MTDEATPIEIEDLPPEADALLIERDDTTSEETPASEDHAADGQSADEPDQEQGYHTAYSIRFRVGRPPFSSLSRISNLQLGETVMVQTDHGPEPALVVGPGFVPMPEDGTSPKASYTILRRASRDENEKYDRLVEREQEAFTLCHQQIRKRQLVMKLIQVERHFNGSKVIFFFTAENRVDFRELVKDLVQEFRTRIEMRQVGVRHETKMLGGLGYCGREFCCASYLTDFSPVSIKMAKAQDLPLNPAKISGTCNRLLCCLTYEYKTYLDLKRGMPRLGKPIVIDGKTCKVIQTNALKETVTILDQSEADPLRILQREEWQKASFDANKRQQPPQGKEEPPPETQESKQEERSPSARKPQKKGPRRKKGRSQE